MSSVTSRVHSPGTFTCARRPAVTVALDAGGADTYTPRAIPGPGLEHCLCTFPIVSSWTRCSPSTKSVRSLLKTGCMGDSCRRLRRATGGVATGGLVAQGAGVRGRRALGVRASAGSDHQLRRPVCAAGQPASSQVSGGAGLSASDRDYPTLTGRSGTQRARRLRSRTAVGAPAPWFSSPPTDLRITRVFSCVAHGFKARASFMFAGCCWWRSWAVDGRSGASRGHAP